jgi:hypothetical protein
MTDKLTVEQQARITKEFVLDIPNSVDHPDAEAYRDRLASLMGEMRKIHPNATFDIPPDLPDLDLPDPDSFQD